MLRGIARTLRVSSCAGAAGVGRLAGMCLSLSAASDEAKRVRFKGYPPNYSQYLLCHESRVAGRPAPLNVPKAFGA
jgi:hypothetical protein